MPQRKVIVVVELMVSAENSKKGSTDAKSSILIQNDHCVPKLCLMSFYLRVAFYRHGYGIHTSASPRQRATRIIFRLVLLTVSRCLWVKLG